MTSTHRLAVIALACAWAGTQAQAAPRPSRAQRAAQVQKVPAGTVVMVELADPVSTKAQKPGDTVNLRLVEPLVVNRRLILPAGAQGVGEVVTASKPGMGGKSARLVLMAKYLTLPGGKQLPLQGLQLSAAGRDRAMASNALGVGGIGFMPLGVVAFAIKGDDVSLPAGTSATAKVASTQAVASLGPAPKDAPSAVIARADQDELGKGAIAVPRPAPGRGLVVFFRRKSVMGTGQWFNVREDGRALGKLTNGAYFFQPAAPGLHTYTAKTEPEFNDQLKIQVDPGEVYFIEGTLTKGVVIGAASLQPSDRGAFNQASKQLAAAPAPGTEPATRKAGG